ncbi:MAG: zinc transport system permease protein [Actinomycetota bacterium]|nr:zinc transport system permease protein [Actinomycetota bacterium]
MIDFLDFDFMRRALFAGALVGLAAPSIGIYLVQRRLALMGDGIGHVTFMGVAVGLALGLWPVPAAIVFAIAGATTIELLRRRGKTASDVALALVFYAGIAGGVLFLGMGNVSNIAVNSFLFGSVLTVSGEDLVIVSVVAIVALAVSLVLRKHLFAISYDEEMARVSGLPVGRLNLLIACLAAVTVAVTAKVVGILLVSAMLVLPVAAAQQISHSFAATFRLSLVMGVISTTTGLVVAFYTDQFPAATIVLVSIGLFVMTSAIRRFGVVR